ncbi:cytochrome P450 [Trichoderma barbatum]
MAILLYNTASTIFLRPITALSLLAVILGFLYITYTVVYNLFFHPLKSFPGPKLWAIHYGFYARLELSGEGHRRILALHQKYGPFVRVAPDHVAICHPDAMEDLQGHRKHGQLENGKDKARNMISVGSIIGANSADHARIRKSVANALSQHAMLEQQPLILSHIDKLFEAFRKFSATGEAFDALSWYNYTTFDIIGDLAFGEPFGCLDESIYHPWVTLVFNSLKNIAYDTTFRRMGLIYKVLVLLIPKSIVNKMKEHNELSAQKVHRRLNNTEDRKDFMTYMTAREGKDALTMQELIVNAGVIIIAGSETSATVLSAATYYLGINPEPLKKLCDEVRSTFATEEEMDLLSVSRLPYMLAVLNEAMRLHPAVPAPAPRTINEMGDTIAGRFVPPGTTVDIWGWAAYHFPDYWAQTEEFIPERWLNDPRFENDKRKVFNPFSIGPRDCIGKNLAYAEMRLILARLIWNYDIEVLEESLGWDHKCECYLAYKKGPLYIRLKPRKWGSDEA